MKRISILILIISLLSSCNTPFDFDEAEKLIENLKKSDRINSLQYFDDTFIINNQKTSKNKDEVKVLNAEGSNYLYTSDYLKSIHLTNEEFDLILGQLKKTKAIRVNYERNKAYFMMSGFLDGSKGYLYSTEHLRNTKETNEISIQLFAAHIKILTKINSNWYQVSAWH